LYPLLLVTALLPTLTFVVPPLNPFHVPHPELTGPVALTAYWTAESGGTTGVPLIGLALTALLVTRRGVPGKRRAVEAAVILDPS
jgi:hypothetical protein